MKKSVINLTQSRSPRGNFLRCGDLGSDRTCEETGKRRKDDRGTASGYRRQIPFHTVICGLRKEKTDKNI